MTREAPGTPPPPGVAARLSKLRAWYRPETLVEGRARLQRERAVVSEPFEVAVARRLRELRALCELARHLHQAKRP